MQAIHYHYACQNATNDILSNDNKI